MEPNEIGQLLDEFDRVPQQPQPERTFMEIAGCPHNEVIASNMLAFFLDSRNSHGLGTTVLKSLLATVPDVPQDLDLEVMELTPEARTESGKFLDLLIETPSVVVGVENKVLAPANNPFAEYAKRSRTKLLGTRRKCSSFFLACASRMLPPTP